MPLICYLILQLSAVFLSSVFFFNTASAHFIAFLRFISTDFQSILSIFVSHSLFFLILLLFTIAFELFLPVSIIFHMTFSWFHPALLFIRVDFLHFPVSFHILLFVYLPLFWHFTFITFLCHMILFFLVLFCVFPAPVPNNISLFPSIVIHRVVFLRQFFFFFHIFFCFILLWQILLSLLIFPKTTFVVSSCYPKLFRMFPIFSTLLILLALCLYILYQLILRSVFFLISIPLSHSLFFSRRCFSTPGKIFIKNHFHI